METIEKQPSSPGRFTGEEKQKVLIVDDSMMNRIVLSDLLSDDYEILEACDGVEAIAELQREGDSIALVLLDINMPNMNGIEVLSLMNRHHWIDSIPVMVISAENSNETVSTAFDLGATDYIDRQFDERIVKRRVHNAIMLYARQRRLLGMVANEIYEREKSSGLMVSILGHIVEFRNQESGMHVQNIRVLTELFLGELAGRLPDAGIDRGYIAMVALASSLHDIGKISIPSEILNKPGRLTSEEFEIMKTHTTIGAEMLESIPEQQQGPLVKVSYEIARWHHERWDGRGYPDGLIGDEIPLSAQVVSLADVYDALTSERVYKPPYSSDKAVEMILNGECGQFNPMLMDCLVSIKDRLTAELEAPQNVGISSSEAARIYDQITSNKDLNMVDRTIQRLERERDKYEFYAQITNEMHFDYTADPPMLILSEGGAEHLGLPMSMQDPLGSGTLKGLLGSSALRLIRDAVNGATDEDSVVDFEVELPYDGEPRWMRVTARVFKDAEGNIDDIAGKIVDNHQEHLRMEQLRYAANYDPLTGLLRLENLYDIACEKLAKTENSYALAIVDVDDFKAINTKYGHQYGNEFLEGLSGRLKSSLRGDDMVARIGADEFVVFAQWFPGEETAINRMLSMVPVEIDGEPVTISVGIAYTDDVGRDYGELFDAADRALLAAKAEESNSFKVYDSSMDKVFADMPSCVGSIISLDGENHRADAEGEVL